MILFLCMDSNNFLFLQIKKTNTKIYTHKKSGDQKPFNKTACLAQVLSGGETTKP